MIHRLRFLIVLTTIAMNFHTYTMHQRPSGTVTYNYKDAHGEHSVVFRAYPEGTLKALQAHAQRNRKFAILSVSGTILLAAGTSVATIFDLALYGADGFSGAGAQQARDTFFTGIALTAACGLFGARAGFRVIRANRMIQSHVDKPQHIRANLNDAYLKNGTHELFVDSHKIKPLEDIINR